MAPQVGLEPTTDRLTADCSTTELLWNICIKQKKAWQRPTLAGGQPPTTIGAEELNDRVRDGNGCDLFAIIDLSDLIMNTELIVTLQNQIVNRKCFDILHCG